MLSAKPQLTFHVLGRDSICIIKYGYVVMNWRSTIAHGTWYNDQLRSVPRMGDGYECDTASRLCSSYRSVSVCGTRFSSDPQWGYTRREKNLNPSLPMATGAMHI